MSRIVDMAIQAAEAKQKKDEDGWKKWVLKTFGSSVDQFAAEGMIIRPGTMPHSGGLQVETLRGWSNTIASLPELGEFFQTTPEEDWKS